MNSIPGYLLLVTFAGLAAILILDQDQSSVTSGQDLKVSGALQAMDWWVWERHTEDGRIPTRNIVRGFEKQQRQRTFDRSVAGSWSFMGPYNVSGRVLTIAFHPTDNDVIFAGSASGGLWKTQSSGAGAGAWSEVETGFPIQAVSCISIATSNPDLMYIGTGEVYGTFQNSEPGIVSRVTRGFYGLGIFKSTDGGDSWSHVLDWALDDLRGVQDITIDPDDSSIVYAATTEGLMRTTNGGDAWEVIHDVPMAIDIEIVSGDPKKIFVSHGNLNFNNNTIPSGVFVSVNEGASFVKVTNGLPEVYSGKALLAISPSDPDVMYASVQHWSTSSLDTITSLGLYRSTDRGESWIRVNDRNVALFQGWYSHDVAVHPDNPQAMMYVGIDTWSSDNGGLVLTKRSDWRLWTFGPLPNVGADGPPAYAHGDIHAVYYHPGRAGHVYLATDGGVFVSEDGGLTYESRNAGLHTTQFYAQAGSSQTDSVLFIGGTQDNASYIRRGPDEWWRVIGGDGMSAYIDPTDNNTLYGSAQGLLIVRIDLAADTLKLIPPPVQQGERVCFNGPFVLAPSAPHIVYAAGQHMYRSDNRGDSWEQRTAMPIDGNNPVLHITVDPENPEVVYVTTSTIPFSGALQSSGVFKSTDGGMHWMRIDEGLPRRLIKQLEVDPSNPDVLYAAVSGFGTEHVYRSDDGGMQWEPSGSGLPDVPANALAVDPLVPGDVYVGTDLGVYYSANGGESWAQWMEGLPQVVLISDLSVSLVNRKLRAVTHGRGIFQRDLENSQVSAVSRYSFAWKDRITLSPNPVRSGGRLLLDLEQAVPVAWIIIDVNGHRVYETETKYYPAGASSVDLTDAIAVLRPGIYFLHVTGAHAGPVRFAKVE